MDAWRPGLVTSSMLRRHIQSSGARQTEDGMAALEGDPGRGPAEKWSLSSHSPGQEPWIVGLEELFRLQREAGDDGLAGEFALIES
jgi:hypothetical protein